MFKFIIFLAAALGPVCGFLAPAFESVAIEILREFAVVKANLGAVNGDLEKSLELLTKISKLDKADSKAVSRLQQEMVFAPFRESVGSYDLWRTFMQEGLSSEEINQFRQFCADAEKVVLESLLYGRPSVLDPLIKLYFDVSLVHSRPPFEELITQVRIRYMNQFNELRKRFDLSEFLQEVKFLNDLQMKADYSLPIPQPEEMKAKIDEITKKYPKFKSLMQETVQKLKDRYDPERKGKFMRHTEQFIRSAKVDALELLRNQPHVGMVF
jgi:hypothetical protein